MTLFVPRRKEKKRKKKKIRKILQPRGRLSPGRNRLRYPIKEFDGSKAHFKRRRLYILPLLILISGPRRIAFIKPITLNAQERLFSSNKIGNRNVGRV